MTGNGKLLSIVVPAFNEASGIQAAIRTLSRVCESLPYAYEIVVVDDGSCDNTFDRAVAMGETDFPVRALRLSRNFGKEAALLAGLKNARGAAVITIDADLQHPPALIPNMVSAWERGAKVVHGVKRDRGEEHWWVTLRASIVNRLLTMLGGIDVRNSSDFKLLDRAVVEVLTQLLPERNRFYRGLSDWVGFSQVELEFDVAPRLQGESGWSWRSLMGLAWTATISFTSAPLRMVSVLGILTLLLGIGVGLEALISWMRDLAISGFVTEIVTMLLLGSFIMISLGVIGEYIAKIYDELKHRPTFIIDGVYNRRVASLPSEPDSLQTLKDNLAVPIAASDSSHVHGRPCLNVELLEYTHDAIIIWEMDGAGIVYWNRAAEQLYGYGRDEVYGETTHTLLKTEVSGGIDDLEVKIARYGVWVGKLKHRARDGRQVLIESRLSLLSQRGGRWLVLEVNRDVTDHVAAEIAQKSLADQLERVRARATLQSSDEGRQTSAWLATGPRPPRSQCDR